MQSKVEEPPQNKKENQQQVEIYLKNHKIIEQDSLNNVYNYIQKLNNGEIKLKKKTKGPEGYFIQCIHYKSKGCKYKICYNKQKNNSGYSDKLILYHKFNLSHSNHKIYQPIDKIVTQEKKIIENNRELIEKTYQKLFQQNNSHAKPKNVLKEIKKTHNIDLLPQFNSENPDIYAKQMQKTLKKKVDNIIRDFTQKQKKQKNQNKKSLIQQDNFISAISTNTQLALADSVPCLQQQPQHNLSSLKQNEEKYIINEENDTFSFDPASPQNFSKKQLKISHNFSSNTKKTEPTTNYLLYNSCFSQNQDESFFNCNQHTTNFSCEINQRDLENNQNYLDQDFYNNNENNNNNCNFNNFNNNNCNNQTSWIDKLNNQPLKFNFNNNYPNQNNTYPSFAYNNYCQNQLKQQENEKNLIKINQQQQIQQQQKQSTEIFDCDYYIQ
ncbi:hypothetical protein PPERSA_05242 [Pseudocohnilembus persalinus]|uniref:Uncharacterized protein n=1 Tax=Pseudocohnilembus persalinus TaxID=266149 RepID=A0A0V0QXW0_PSEPJ|nr:hypothetical protein PPERSA_05242 [Pseudocohnilembus persalinus]|eukprot:KRX07078.1 hypothetical protein PPERSA_05242 [Pseudocohnilembus persalinus]